MVSNENQTTCRRPVNQRVRADIPEPNKIGASTPYDFEARNLTAYGGLLPVATMLEQLGFQQLVEEKSGQSRGKGGHPKGAGLYIPRREHPRPR
jgi:hypothetical protein